MSSTWKAVASSGFEEITMSRSSFRMRWTQSTVSWASLAGSTVKSWSYLFLKYRASFARSPASASVTGDDSSPTVDTSLKSTLYAMERLRSERANDAAQSGARSPGSHETITRDGDGSARRGRLRQTQGCPTAPVERTTITGGNA